MNYGHIINSVSIYCPYRSYMDKNMIHLLLVPIFIQRLTFCTSLEILPLMEIPGIKRVSNFIDSTSIEKLFFSVSIRQGPRLTISSSRLSNSSKFSKSRTRRSHESSSQFAIANSSNFSQAFKSEL